MKKINFKKIYAENFLCFGSDGIEINFSNYNNIVLVRGKNLDVVQKSENQDKNSSNGVGKSSIPAVLVYGLYGKTIRKPNKIGHKDVINNEAGKKLKVEVYWDDYKLQRTRKPDGLKLWKSDKNIWDETTEISLGGMPATQKLIESIVGMSYETFINVAVFTDDNTSSFLECDAAEKRQIVENLLSLEKYRTYHENAKKIIKTHKDFVKSIEKDIDYKNKSINDESANLKRLVDLQAQWKKNKKDEIEKYTQALSILDAEKSKVIDNDEELKKYQEVLVKIKDFEKKISDLESVLSTLESNELSLIEIYNKFKEQNDSQSKLCISIADELKTLNNEVNSLLKNIAKIENLEDGVQCSHCLSIVDKNSHQILLNEYKKELVEKNDILKSNNELFLSEKDKLQKTKTSLDAVITKTNSVKVKIKESNTEKNNLNKDLNDLLKIKKPEENAKLKAIENKISIVKTQLEEKISEAQTASPYETLIETSKDSIINLEKEKADKETDLQSANEKTKYYEYWMLAFGDAGIRKYVIDEIIPALNSNINYWMQFLIENKITLKFNNEFEETIEKYPTDNTRYVYECMSNGQRRRINLALSQAFAHVMSINSGRTPSIVFLDEVTSNIDPQGVSGIYNMICELTQEKQVFITTHDHDLLEFLNGCDTLDLVMEKGTTKLEK